LLFFRKLEVHALVSIVVSCDLRVAGGIATANSLSGPGPCLVKIRIISLALAQAGSVGAANYEPEQNKH
jgi:hypothetical protein